jgi:hypothetical protein|tara:strand:- start:220 stop:438 length:219 start_codon:yes stop_codon:yes gene_type:complete
LNAWTAFFPSCHAGKYGKQISDRLVHGFQHDLRVELKQQQLEHGGSVGVLGRGGGIIGAMHYPAHSHRVCCC